MPVERGGERFIHFGQQLLVIAFERQHVVTAASDDLGSNLLLAAHRVDGDRGAFQVE